MEPEEGILPQRLKEQEPDPQPSVGESTHHSLEGANLTSQPETRHTHTWSLKEGEVYLRACLHSQHAVQVHVEAPLVDSSLPRLRHGLCCAAEVRARQILVA